MKWLMTWSMTLSILIVSHETFDIDIKKVDQKHAGCRSESVKPSAAETILWSEPWNRPWQSATGPHRQCSCHKIESCQNKCRTCDTAIIIKMFPSSDLSLSLKCCYKSDSTFLSPRDSTISSSAASHIIASWMIASGLIDSRNLEAFFFALGIDLRS